MNKFTTTFAFLCGALIGGAAVWYYAKDKYAKIADEEINSVKEAYAKHEQKQAKDTAVSQTVLTDSKVQDKGNIKDYARRIQGERNYTQYSQAVVPPKEVKTDPDIAAPYVISPDEFGELDDYTKICLSYFADDVLSDEYGVVFEDPEELIGDALEHFGEYEEDSVFCRDDLKRCDYEILKDLRAYADFRKTLPPNI